MSHMGVASDLSLGRPSSSMGRPIFSYNPNLTRFSCESSTVATVAHPSSYDLAQLESYVRALEHEREKIDALQREFPICMRILDDAIEASRVKLTKVLGESTSHANYSSYLNKATLSSEMPIQWKPNWEKQGPDITDEQGKVEAAFSAWSKPLQLNHQYTQEQSNTNWNHANTLVQRGASPARCVKLEFIKQMKADHSFHESSSDHHVIDDEQAIDHSSPTSAGAAGVMRSSSNGLGQQPRKARRCWSPDLHQRFLHALHQLGGPQMATPKQIREVMNVEGLTNDEVKSHLQKFRLHTRRPAQAAAAEPAQQPHHFVLFGGIWMPTSPLEAPPAQLGAAAAMTTACSQDQPLSSSSLCHAGGGGGAGGHARSVSHHDRNPYMQFGQHTHHPSSLIGHTPMHTLMNAATLSDQLEIQGGMEPAASEEDMARSDQSTSLNGAEVGGGVDNQHEEEDIEIQLVSKRLSREINSPIAKARY